MTVSTYTGRGGVKLWRYSFNYRAAGTRQHVERRGFSTKRDAADAERRRRIEVAALDGATAVDGTVSDYLRSWLIRYTESGSRKLSTVANARLHVDKYLAPRLENVKLRKLNLDIVQRVMNDLHTSGSRKGEALSAKTISCVHGTLHKALGDAVRWRILPYNAAEGVDLPRRTQYVGDAYDSAEMGQLLDYLTQHADPSVSVIDYTLIRVALATGLRRGELCGLRWRDVDLVERRLTVRSNRVVVDGQVVETDPKTRSGLRAVTFDADTGDALGRLRNALEAACDASGSPLTDNDYVATRLDGQPIHPLTFVRRWHRHSKGAGLRPIRFHDSRASHVQESYRLGVDAVTVSRRVGHSRTSTTLDLYGRLMPSSDHSAADVIGATLSESQVNARTTDETSCLLRAVRAGNDTKRRTTQDTRPAQNLDGTTKHTQTVEATPRIERGYEWAEQALY
jgi:integrase